MAHDMIPKSDELTVYVLPVPLCDDVTDRRRHRTQQIPVAQTLQDAIFYATFIYVPATNFQFTCNPATSACYVYNE